MTKELPPSRTAEQFVVRFPEGMRDRIAEVAKSNNRSMNAEIVARLEQSFGSDSQRGGLSFEQTLRELESLQKLGSLTYELQRATYKADALRTHMGQAYDQLQRVIERGSDQEQEKAKAVYHQLQVERARFTSEIENIEKQISEIHLERKISGLKELRDVQPVYASIDVKYSDAVKPPLGISSKKPTDPSQ